MPSLLKPCLPCRLFGETSAHLLLALAIMDSAAAATFTVTNTADSGPGSLRQAILDSNANGINDSDSISFAISGAGPHLIAPTSELPEIRTGNITIDGYTQPGASPNTLTTTQGGLNTQLRVALSAQNGISGSNGLSFSNFGGPGTRTVRGLAIVGFIVHIRFEAQVGELIVEGNYIGADTAGTVPSQPGSARVGVRVGNMQGNLRIGGLLPAQRNLFAGLMPGSGSALAQSGVGVDITMVNGGTVAIQGNLIGTDPTGTLARGLAIGVRVRGVGGSGASVQIGGTDANARNLISGNRINAIALGTFSDFLVDRVIVEGNWIGTDASGLLPLPNGELTKAIPTAAIIREQNAPGSSRSRIGGSAPGAANRIAFNVGPGIRVSGNRFNGWGGAIEIGENQIFLNTGIPVDNVDVLRANDPGDGDVGANRIQNFPVFQNAQRLPGLISFSFQVDTALANASYPLRVDFYRSNAFGDALALLGTASIAAADAQTMRTASLTDSGGIGFLTAIATDAEGNSSEFSDVVDIDRILTNGFE